jgi:hypothetical protein
MHQVETNRRLNNGANSSERIAMATVKSPTSVAVSWRTMSSYWAVIALLLLPGEKLLFCFAFPDEMISFSLAGFVNNRSDVVH